VTAKTGISRFAGRRILLVHYGEDIPLDDGYRPLRVGRLARDLIDAGADVTRYCPTFSALSRRQRPMASSGSSSHEGVVILIPTRAYRSSRGYERLGFISDFAKGVGRAARCDDQFDLAIVGYPPPGVAGTLRRSVGGSLPILADIRDLWPDALAPSGNRLVTVAAATVGKFLSQELRATRGVVAASEMMLGRAPRSKRRRVIPIGIAAASALEVPLGTQGSMRVVFVGTFSQLFDIGSMLEGWSRFVESTHRTGDAPVLELAGHGENAEAIQCAAQKIRGVHVAGRVPSTDVPALLASADVGVAPTRKGQGTTVSNKISEYFGAGLFVLHSLEPAVGAGISRLGLGRHVSWSPAEWKRAFAAADRGLKHIRSTRLIRQERANSEFGPQVVREQWFSEIDAALESGQTPRFRRT